MGSNPVLVGSMYDAGGNAEILTQVRPVRFSTEHVQPPTSVYIALEDVLQIVAIGDGTSNVITVSGRLLLPGGEIKAFSQAFGPLVTNTVFTGTLQLAEGFLLNLTVTTATAAVKVGSLYAVASLVRGASSSLSTHETFLAGYITSNQGLAWPGGILRSSVEGPGLLLFTSSAHSAGAELLRSATPRQRWRIKSIRATLVTSAVAGNRVVNAQVFNGAAIVGFSAAASNVQAASTTVVYTFIPGGSINAFANGTQLMPLPAGLELQTGTSFQTVTTLLDAGDQWTTDGVEYEQLMDISA